MARFKTLQAVRTNEQFIIIMLTHHQFRQSVANGSGNGIQCVGGYHSLNVPNRLSVFLRLTSMRPCHCVFGAKRAISIHSPSGAVLIAFHLLIASFLLSMPTAPMRSFRRCSICDQPTWPRFCPLGLAWLVCGLGRSSNRLPFSYNPHFLPRYRHRCSVYSALVNLIDQPRLAASHLADKALHPRSVFTNPALCADR